MAVRLAGCTVPAVSGDPPSTPERALRAERARQWLATLALPQQARLAFLRAYDASTASPAAAGDALAELSRTLAGHLDAAAARELAGCAERLRLYFDEQAS